MLWLVDNKQWSEAYRHIATGIYNVRDQRDNSGAGSMNKFLANITDYAMDADGNNYNMWDPEQKCNEYFTDMPYAFKMLGGLYAINAAIVLNDNEMFWKRGLPQAEYALSREHQYFQPYDVNYGTQMTISREMNGPFMSGIDLGNLYYLTGGRTTAFKTYSQEKGFSASNGSFQQSLEWYRLWGNSTDLTAAVNGAYWSISNRYHYYDFQKFLEIYNETGNPDFLQAAKDAGYQFVTTLNACPRVPDVNVVVDRYNAAPIHWHSFGRHVLWGFPPPLPMYAPEQSVPAWRPAVTGMMPEAYRAFTFSEYPGALLRLSDLANDTFLHDMARWALVGRWANYPGQQTSRAHSLVWELDDFCMHPLQYMTFTSMHFWHHWMYFAYAIDYLVSDTIYKADGNITFPLHRMFDGNGRMNMWGERTGIFYGDENVVLWLPRNLLTISTQQINYIAGYGNGKLYLALSNQSANALNNVTISLNPNLVAYGSAHKAKVWKENIRQNNMSIFDGSFTVDVAPKGLTVLAIEDITVKTSRVHTELFKSAGQLAQDSLARTQEPFGKMVGMVISFGPEQSEAYCYTDAKPYWLGGANDVNYITMNYSIDNGPWQQVIDRIFPYEFSTKLNLNQNTQSFRYYFDALTINNTHEISATRTLSLAVTVPSPAISGRVTDLDGTGIGGVLIQSSDSQSATTNSNGYYTITDVSNGLKTLTVSKGGYSFIPAHRPVNVQGRSIANVNWFGRAGSLDSFDYLAVLAEHWLEDNTVLVGGSPVCEATPPGDLDENCKVNFLDFALIP